MKKKIKIVITGDSTAASYDDSLSPMTGWGQTFAGFFNDEVIVLNHASPGRSTKSFIDERRLEAALNELGAGDYLFIQFGHNDEKIEDPTRYTEPFTTYKQNLAVFVTGARERGASPVLLTSIERRIFDPDGRIKATHGEYPQAMAELAREMDVPLIDITAKSKMLFEKLGDEKTKELFMHLEPGENANYPDGAKDDTHFRIRGAVEIGKLVMEGLTEMGSKLVEYMVSGR